ncbi:RraA family protein [Paraburkholderia terrae]
MSDEYDSFADTAISVRRTAGLAASQLERAARLGSATLHEAGGRIGALPSSIKPTAPRFRVAGPAFTVHCPPNDNLWIHRAIKAASPGDILVVYASGHYEAGYWGEVMSTAAVVARLGGLVIDASVRDGALLEEVGFPVFARGLCIRGTGKDFGATGWLNKPVMMGDVLVSPGDLVVGDADGVVAIPNERVSEVLLAAEKRDAMEKEVLTRLRAGESTLQVFGLDR